MLRERETEVESKGEMEKREGREEKKCNFATFLGYWTVMWKREDKGRKVRTHAEPIEFANKVLCRVRVNCVLNAKLKMS